MFQSVAENVAKFKMEIDIFKKQPSEVVSEKSYSKKFRKIYRKKKHVLESLLRPHACNFINRDSNTSAFLRILRPF